MLTLIFVIIALISVISLIVRFVTWITRQINPVKTIIENEILINEPVKKERPIMEHSEEYKRFHIAHMIQVVQTQIHNKTGKMVNIAWPNNEEEKLKLKKMYDGVLENIGK